MTFGDVPIGSDFIDDRRDRWTRISRSHARRLRDGVEIWWAFLWEVEAAP